MVTRTSKSISIRWSASIMSPGNRNVMNADAPRSNITRRRFLGGALLATAAASAPAVLGAIAAEDSAPTPAAAEFKRQVKLGVIGCGSRGKWIARLFAGHGGYALHVV